MAESGDVQIKITTEANLAALQKTREELQKQIDLAKKAGDGYYHLQTRLSEVDKELKPLEADAQKAAAANEKLATSAKHAADAHGQMHAAAEKVREAVPILGQLASAISLPLVFAIGLAATAFEKLKEGLQSYMKIEVQNKKMEQALRVSGQLTEENTAKIRELKAELKETTGINFGDAITRLIQFDTPVDKLGDYTTAIKNLAGIMDGDVDAAAHVFTKSLDGNMDMLGRYGIHLESTGNQIEDMDNLMRLLAERGGGQLEARMQTLSGKFTQAEHAAEGLSKKFGKLLADTGILQTGLAIVTDAFEYWSHSIHTTTDRLDGVSGATRRTGQSFREAKAATEAFKKQLEEVKEEADKEKTALGNLMTKISAYHALVNSLDQKKKANALADIDRKERAGVLNPQDATRQRALIDEEYEKNRLRNEKASRDEQVKAQEDSVKVKEANLKKVQDRQNEVTEKQQVMPDVEARNRTAKKDKEELDSLKKRLSDFKEGIEEKKRTAKSGQDKEIVKQQEELVPHLEEEVRKREIISARSQKKATDTNESSGKLATEASQLQKMAEAQMKELQEAREKLARDRESAKMQDDFAAKGFAVDTDTGRKKANNQMSKEAEKNHLPANFLPLAPRSPLMTPTPKMNAEPEAGMPVQGVPQAKPERRNSPPAGAPPGYSEDKKTGEGIGKSGDQVANAIEKLGDKVIESHDKILTKVEDLATRLEQVKARADRKAP